MREPAPADFGGPYERPNQAWVCGLAGDGSACPAGPLVDGRCPALAECTPQRDGERWQCNRSLVRGGKCDDGPTPEGRCGRVNHCQPVWSLRAVRGRFVAACTLLTAGALVIVLSSDWRNRVITPGPLAMSHAQLLERVDSKPNCAACHGTADVSLAGWTASLVGAHGDRPTQSHLCMKCHGETFRAERALAAHNLPAELLRRQRTDDDHPRAITDIDCATCHREHHGPNFDLTAMDNAACQACHQQRYESFAADHPNFGVWPYDRRTRIAFSHASHQSKHFAEKKQSFDCRSCHVEDATRAVQLTLSYETACAKCHDEKIATSVARGVPMFVVPTLDVEALAAAGHDIRDWPEAASGDFDGRLPPAMKLMLAADPSAAAAIARLGDDFEFGDIDPDASEQLAACATLATAIKAIVNDLSLRGPAAVRDRLTVALGRDIADAEVAALVSGLSFDTVRGAEIWFASGARLSPRSGPSMLESRANMPMPRRGEGIPLTVGDGHAVAFAPAGAWMCDEVTVTIRYRPAAHADPVLTGWLQVLAATQDLHKRPLALAMFHELSRPTAAGLCASCHSIEQEPGGAIRVNWRGGRRDSFSTEEHSFDPWHPGEQNSRLRRPFTKFSHGPHMILPQLADCTACHALDTSAESSAAYVDWNPRRFVSEFAPMLKQHCAACHRKSAAGDRCQSCHHYHVELVGMASPVERPAK